MALTETILLVGGPSDGETYTYRPAGIELRDFKVQLPPATPGRFVSPEEQLEMELGYGLYRRRPGTREFEWQGWVTVHVS